MLRRLTCLLVLVVVGASVARAESPPITMFKNDEWFPGDAAGFDSTLAANHIIASRFTIGDTNLMALEVLYSGATSSHPVTVKIWDDTAGALAPGAELFTTQVTLTGSPSLQFIALPGIAVPFRFRVGIALLDAPPPSIAFDTDGTIEPDTNFVQRAGTWEASTLTGDWIIRIHTLPGGGGGGGGSGGGSGGNFPCNSDSDCNGAPCDHGQCQYGDAGDTGCCGASGGPSSLALATLLAALWRRRRGRRA